VVITGIFLEYLEIYIYYIYFIFGRAGIYEGILDGVKEVRVEGG
jgi:hypothetical protein